MITMACRGFTFLILFSLLCFLFISASPFDEHRALMNRHELRMQREARVAKINRAGGSWKASKPMKMQNSIKNANKCANDKVECQNEQMEMPKMAHAIFFFSIRPSYIPVLPNFPMRRFEVNSLVWPRITKSAGRKCW